MDRGGIGCIFSAVLAAATIILLTLRQGNCPPVSRAASGLHGEKRPRVLHVWLNDVHTGLAEDLKALWSRHVTEFEFVFYDFSLAWQCKWYGTCADGNFTRILSTEDILAGAPDAAVTRFYDHFASDPRMKEVDLFLCTHPVNGCRVFYPFNKTIVAVAAVPVSFTAPNKPQFVAEFRRLAADDRNVVGANNRYHQAEILSQTGVLVHYLRSHALYNTAEYDRSRKPSGKFIVARTPTPIGATDIQRAYDAAYGGELRFVNFQGGGIEAYAAYDAVIYFPYTFSLMTFFELYRANIPIFVPSLDFMVRNEMSGTGTAGGLHDHYVADDGLPSLSHHSNVRTADSRREWIALSDFQTYPYVGKFSDIRELLELLKVSNFAKISAAMKAYNEATLKESVFFWRHRLNELFGEKQPDV